MVAIFLKPVSLLCCVMSTKLCHVKLRKLDQLTFCVDEEEAVSFTYRNQTRLCCERRLAQG